MTLKTIRNTADLVINAVLPHCCPACGVLVASPGGLCAPCFQGLTFITEPTCAICGLPRGGGAEGDGELCPDCIVRRPNYGRARAALLYDANSASLILGLKYADRTETAAMFARWMAYAGAPLFSPDALLIPVPLHRRRLFVRRYNQATLLANEISKLTGHVVRTRLLRRARFTRSQGTQDRSRRLSNVAGAFTLSDVGPVQDRAIILIDDVMTTGATIEACAQTLRQSGARSVNALCLARVPSLESGMR